MVGANAKEHFRSTGPGEYYYTGVTHSDPQESVMKCYCLGPVPPRASDVFGLGEALAA